MNKMVDVYFVKIERESKNRIYSFIWRFTNRYLYLPNLNEAIYLESNTKLVNGNAVWQRTKEHKEMLSKKDEKNLFEVIEKYLATGKFDKRQIKDVHSEKIEISGKDLGELINNLMRN